jgi:hypothetical protein
MGYHSSSIQRTQSCVCSCFSSFQGMPSPIYASHSQASEDSRNSLRETAPQIPATEKTHAWAVELESPDEVGDVLPCDQPPKPANPSESEVSKLSALTAAELHGTSVVHLRIRQDPEELVPPKFMAILNRAHLMPKRPF